MSFHDIIMIFVISGGFAETKTMGLPVSPSPELDNEMYSVKLVFQTVWVCMQS